MHSSEYKKHLGNKSVFYFPQQSVFTKWNKIFTWQELNIKTWNKIHIIFLPQEDFFILIIFSVDADFKKYCTYVTLTF